MKISDLAQSLGISRQMVHKHKARGMPCDSLESAIEWRRQNLDVTQTKSWRIDGNSGVKLKSPTNNAMNANETMNQLDIETVNKVLTHLVPKIWFEQIGWLGGALRDHGVKITAEQLIKVQAILFYVYMVEVDNLLQAENQFKIPEALSTNPGDRAYLFLIESLNQTLGRKPIHLYES